MKNIKKVYPNFDIENNFPKNNVLGVDEAGRGPISGPVVSCCVYISRDQFFDDKILSVNDSKKLSATKRLDLFNYLVEKVKYNIAIVDNKEIDRINILNSTKKSMVESYLGLVKKYKIENSMVLVDGNFNPFSVDDNVFCQPIIKGDQKSISIACASIIAKVSRDAIMSDLHCEYPEFDWQQNSGYPTKKHIVAIEKFGVTCYHRNTFAPIKLNKYKKYG